MKFYIKGLVLLNVNGDLYRFKLPSGWSNWDRAVTLNLYRWPLDNGYTALGIKEYLKLCL